MNIYKFIPLIAILIIKPITKMNIYKLTLLIIITIILTNLFGIMIPLFTYFLGLFSFIIYQEIQEILKK